ncbi:MAG: tetratricopeptide repeat protein [Bryobacterales bacterium]|nr:tetratricopeptide repeat protein [Bryobacterales bacterium]
MVRHIILLVAACAALSGQAKDPAGDPLSRAYQALAARSYDEAIASFLIALKASPGRAAVHKDLAYTYLKTGETEAARDQFAEAMRLDPGDYHAALEYGFLCHETGRTAEARRVFDEIRRSGDPDSRGTAETAFQNVDLPLAEGIERWRRALEANPGDYTAHHELARLAERRGDLPLAAEHFLMTWKLRPAWRSVLVELGRTWLAMGMAEQGRAALLAASRGPEPRAAEAARGLLPGRYPYVYEFRQAIELDPENVALREELGYLLQAMGRRDEARKVFEAIPAVSEDPAGQGPPRELGDQSYKAGQLRDALRYYAQALREDPLDFRAMLQLGWTHNVLGQDREAIRWFGLARKSPEPAISREAARAYGNLRPSLARLRTTVWFFPVYSSRWRDTFAYGQMRTELKLGRLPLRGYLSARLIGDSRRLTAAAGPGSLSESAVIFGAGLATDYWHGMMLWAEAGSAVSYLENRTGQPRMAPDYRGGAAFYRGFGRLLSGRQRGAFLETNDDGVFISRFQNDVVLYSQNRAGYTLAPSAALGGFQTQWYWNANLSKDLRRQHWANAVESGPGLRFRWNWMPRGAMFSVNYLRGRYTVTAGNPWSRDYTDLRIGAWWAATR